MTRTDRGNLAGRKWRLIGRQQLMALWPQGPLAAVLILAGALNIVDGLNLPMSLGGRISELAGLGQSLSALGGTMQAILGLLFLVAGIGLLWRSTSAWRVSGILCKRSFSLATASDLQTG
jgi:hypothetical protein